VVVQWDKESLEDVGLVKIDLLGLRMLSAIAETVEIVEGTGGRRPDLEHLSFDDPAIFEMVGRADTIGVFQVESQRSSPDAAALSAPMFCRSDRGELSLIPARSHPG